MPGIKYLLLFLLLFSFSFFLFAQDQVAIDDLTRLMGQNVHDTVKLKKMMETAWNSFRTYPEKSLIISKDALKLAKNLNRYKDEAKCDNIIGSIFSFTGKYDSASFYYSRCLAIGLERKDDGLIAKGYGNSGLNYYYRGIYDKALENYFKALVIDEKTSDSIGLANTLVNIGNTYIAMNTYNNAREYLNKAYAIFEKINNKRGMANTLNSLGAVYVEIDSLRNRAIDCYERSLKIKEELDDRFGISNTLHQMAALYGREKKYIKEIELYEKALIIKRELNDKSGIAKLLINIGIANNNLKRNDDALRCFYEALKISEETGNYYDKQQSYLGIAITYSKFKNFEKAYEFKNLYLEVSDTIMNHEKAKQIIEMQTKYETEKKEKEILLLNKDKEIKSKDLARQKLMTYSVIAGLLLMALIAVIIFRSLKVTQRQKVVIEKQKLLVDEKNRHIEEKQKEIIDSITYAKRLQEAILPPAALIKKHLPESFLLYIPKDIVAGDFYWIETCADVPSSGIEFIFVAAADCTGHGVPGAMVSVVCSNALNRAVKEFRLRETGKILDKVTDLVLETFEKSGKQIKDGMDISLLKIEIDCNNHDGAWNPARVEWSGANNPLWYISNGVLVEIKADKQPVGKFDNRKPFTTHSIEARFLSPSFFYLFTDGMADQFGGPKEKKFMYKRFEEGLLKICNFPMDAQLSALEKIFLDWKGHLEQVDDVTVIGIKI